MKASCNNQNISLYQPPIQVNLDIIKLEMEYFLPSTMELFLMPIIKVI